MLFDLKFPPGIYRNGTDYQSKGRYHNCNLMRFSEGVIRPFGGWREKSLTTVTGRGRAMHAWKTNAGASQLAIGTESNLYVMDRTGAIIDITPAGLTAGYATSTSGGGYGDGLYGAGTYGTPRKDVTAILDATMWTLDNRGENLIACCWTDGKLYEWAPGDPLATQISGSPSSCRSVVMTPERFVMAAGADNDPRLVQWCDQEDETDWTPSDTNQAGSFPLQTPGRCMLAKAARDYTLILTDVDSWVASYLGFPLVYSFTNVGGDGTGAISQGAAVAIDSQCVWMGQNNFWTCDGSFVRPLPSDVQDFVFSDINRQQQALVTCAINSDFGEVIWRYPSTGALEIDSYVLWNYRENHWNIGSLQRLSAVDRGVFQYPLAISKAGQIFEHEVGFQYDDAEVFLQSGPIELADGDNVATALRLIPDNSDRGAVQMTFRLRNYPLSAQTTIGPYESTQKTDLRFTARAISVRYTMASSQDFRIGVPRLELKAGGRR